MTPLELEHLCFERGGREQLERVKPLWEQPNRHHLLKSNHFKQHYAAFTFDMRCRKFGEDSALQVCIDLVRDKNSATIHLAAVEGNQAFFEFYARHCFRMRKTILEFVPEQGVSLEGIRQP